MFECFSGDQQNLEGAKLSIAELVDKIESALASLHPDFKSKQYRDKSRTIQMKIKV